MIEKIERQKLMERDELTYDEKKRIALKSDDQCCHCGKKAYFGFEATVDHFIPISKGGNNRDINLIMLCRDCNKNKGNKIVYPGTYLPYLKEEHRNKLEDYFESYIQSFEYISRQNLLSCDEYQVSVCPLLDPVLLERKKRKNKKWKEPVINYLLKRAYEDDKDKICEYFIEYLKRHNALDDEDAARYNIEFWMKFGCIYYVESADGIKLMIALTIRKIGALEQDDDGVENALNMTIFPKYANDTHLTLTHGTMRSIVRFIMNEQSCTQMPVAYSFLSTETAAVPIFNRMHQAPALGSNVLTVFTIAHTKDNDEDLLPKDDPNLTHFFGKIKDVTKEAEEWIEQHPDLAWMWDELNDERSIPQKNDEN